MAIDDGFGLFGSLAPMGLPMGSMQPMGPTIDPNMVAPLDDEARKRLLQQLMSGLPTAIAAQSQAVPTKGTSDEPHTSQPESLSSPGSFGVSRDKLSAGDESGPSADGPDLTGQAPGNLEAKLLNKAPGVDPRLYNILDKATDALPEGYSARVSSGLREGDPRFHGRGQAMDVEIIGPDGKVLPNYQDPKAFRSYEQLAQQARQVQQQIYPGLDNALRWGGYFSGPKGKYGALDTMHFDLGGGRVGMAGGTWENGLTAAQRAMFPGAQSAGMGGTPSSAVAYAPDSGSAPLPPRRVQVASADPNFVPASASTAPQSGRPGLFDNLFGSLAPVAGGSQSPQSGQGQSGGLLSDNPALANMLQALAFSMATATDRRTPFANAPAFLLAMQKQQSEAADKAYQRSRDEKSDAWQRTVHQDSLANQKAIRELQERQFGATQDNTKFSQGLQLKQLEMQIADKSKPQIIKQGEDVYLYRPETGIQPYPGQTPGRTSAPGPSSFNPLSGAPLESTPSLPGAAPQAPSASNAGPGLTKLIAGEAKAPTTIKQKLADGSEVSLQWDGKKGAFVPLNAPEGGNSVRPIRS